MISNSEQRALDQIDDDELIRWVQELTRIPSVWKPDEGEHGVGEEAAARWVEARCHEIGLDTHFEFVVPGRPNVIGLYSPHPNPLPKGEGGSSSQLKIRAHQNQRHGIVDAILNVGVR